MTTLLSVRDLVVEFPVKGGRFRALDRVSFDVERGRTLAVVGESGSGKSTLARALVRLTTPDSGRIELDGTDYARLPERQLRSMRSRVQMVFQDPYGSLDPHQTAADIIAEPLRTRDEFSSRADRAREAARLIDLVHLPESALERKPAEFSGGQRQRIGIARALASRPEVLVCDEATSALDVSVQAQILRLFAELQESTGVTYVFISHNLAVVREISQEILVLRRGAVVESGRTADVLWSPTDPYTRRLRAAALDPTTIVGVKDRHVLRAAERIG